MNFLDFRVLICVGSGGVGKTTLSAALALKAARAGKRVLVMTIDPSRRLKSALGLDQASAASGDVVQVPIPLAEGRLDACILDAQKIFEKFIRSSSMDPGAAERLLRNRLYEQLSTTLSGSQEFTSLLQLTQMVENESYDLVILDTPPAQHAVEFLEAPEKIYALFQDSVVRWFIGGEQVGFIRKVLAQGTKTVLGALEFITGMQFMQELADFFTSVRSVQEKISRKTEQVREILRAPTTGFLMITGFDEPKLLEADGLQTYLRSQSYRLSGIIVNRAFPKWFENTNEGVADGDDTEYLEWRRYYEDRNAHYRKFLDQWAKTLTVTCVPELNSDLTGIKALEVMCDEL
jgi:anion-transporting  ArsA/GET3 family ATPase